jgi:hypothetical protein
MTRTVTMLALLAGALPGAVTLGTVEIPPADVDWDACLTYDIETGEPRIDPSCFFDVLIDRYQRLKAYEDVSDVTQVTRRAGEEPKELQTRIGCEIEEGKLHVETPASQIRRGMGLDLEYRRSRAMEAAALEYDIWLAPHMALRFADEPRREFRAGVADGFTATDAETITIDARPMVHLELRAGDGRDGDCAAQFDLYVNPESMLIERIEGTQRLPDGGDFRTTLDITPLAAEIEARVAEPKPEPESQANPDSEPAAGAAPGAQAPVRRPKTAGHVAGLR